MTIATLEITIPRVLLLNPYDYTVPEPCLLTCRLDYYSADMYVAVQVICHKVTSVVNSHLSSLLISIA